MSDKLTRDSLLAALRDHIGEANGIAGHQLCRKIVGFTADGRDERQMRKLIQQLRHEGHHICGFPDRHGYYLAETTDELDRTCAFLTERAMTSLTQVSAMKRVSIPDLFGQLKLPT